MSEPFAISNVTVLNGNKSGRAQHNMTVLVSEDGTIERVGKSAEIALPRDFRVIDADGKVLVPGLINVHAHVFGSGKPLSNAMFSPHLAAAVSRFVRSPLGTVGMKKVAAKFIQTEMLSGVTTLRTLGDTGYQVVDIAQEIDNGTMVGPRVLASGPLLAVTGGHGSPMVTLTSDSPWEARRNVRQSLRAGVSVIKIAATAGVTDAKRLGEAGRPQMTEEEMEAICDEAHSAGLIVAAHAQSREGVLRALKAGVDTIEHGSSMTKQMVDLFHKNPKSLRGYSSLTPTLLAAEPLVRLDRSITGITDVVYSNAKKILDEMLSGLATARKEGIAIGSGTDSSCTYVTQYGMWRELDFLCRFGGMSPAEALHTATQSNAEIMGLNDVTGSIEAGKAADMVLLDGNPLEAGGPGFRVFDQPVAVVVRGKVLLHPVIPRIAEIDEQLDTL